MRVIRLYNDDAGESHFEDVELAAERGSTGGGNVSLSVPPLSVSSLFLRDVVVEDESSEPHCAPRRQFVVMLRGSAEIQASDGERRRIGPGDVVFVEDLEGRGHTFLGAGPDRRTMIVAVSEGFVLPRAE